MSRANEAAAIEPAGWIELPCACANLRRFTRLATRMYDEALRPSGLETGQFALLATIRRYPDLTQARLADGFAMEASSLRRTLAVLVRRGLVKKLIGPDRRDRVFHLTSAGEAQFERARPCWYEAQRKFSDAVGDDAMQALSRLTEQASFALVAAQTEPQHQL